MAANWTFGRLLGVGYSLAVAVLLVVAVVGYSNTTNLIEDSALVSHTHQVRRELASLMAELIDAETGERGYIITGDDAYLEPYTAGRNALRATQQALARLVADDPDQQRRVESLSPLIDARLQAFERALQARRTGGIPAAVASVSTNHGKELMDRIRAIIAEADRKESDLLAQRASAAVESSAWTERTILWGGVIGVVLVALVGFYTVGALTRRVGGAVGSVQSSSAELQSAANQQAASAKEQAGAMNEIATTIRELIATSRQIAQSAQRVAHVAEETEANARDGGGTVDNATASIESIRLQVDRIVNHMLDLGRKSQQIGAVLDIVAELAEQTNILAINASIEAAGAGDAGNRFSVVADEIRKLSDRVSGSTKEIRALIDDVRAAVNTTVMATESGSKAVDAGTRQFGDVASSFNRILSMVATATEAAKEIELSTKQQATAVEQVNIAISNVSQASQETEASSNQILQTSSELASLSRELARIIRPEARK